MDMNPKEVFIADYDYVLPLDRIAAFPLADRDASKLLIYKEEGITVSQFKDLAAHLPQHTTLVINNTRVIEARLYFQKETGAQIEIFCLSPYSPAEMTDSLSTSGMVQWNCLIGGASKWKPGLILTKELLIEEMPVVLSARYVGKSGEQFIIEFSWNSNNAFAEILHVAGHIPLPPYIKRKAAQTDAERYQTVFARHQGSVAAPTAALHFTPPLFDNLKQKGISTTQLTLHVGAGTFKPVKSDTIADHDMHAENFTVTISSLEELIRAEILIAVGTTSLRTLESLYWIGIKLLKGNTDLTLKQWEAMELSGSDHISYKESLQAIINWLKITGLEQVFCTTSLLIMPGYVFRSANALITNFHQPRSTLLLLVAAFTGGDWKRIYDHALADDFRFLSYGDSSLLWRK
jgi:S-adenosylmethionine:tRNA ribosyltransferase-isomerase